MAFKLINTSQPAEKNCSSQRLISESDQQSLRFSQQNRNPVRRDKFERLDKNRQALNDRYYNNQDYYEDSNINHTKTIWYNSRNIENENFSKKLLEKEARSNAKVLNSSFCMLSNLFAVLHQAVFQMMVAALPQAPVTLITFVILLQLFYLFSYLVPLFSIKRYMSWLDLIGRILHSFFITPFFLVLLIICFTNKRRKKPVDETLQYSGILLVMLGLISNYLITFLKLFGVVIDVMKKYGCKKKKKEESEVLDILPGFVEKKGLVFYHLPSHENQNTSSSSSIKSIYAKRIDGKQSMKRERGFFEMIDQSLNQYANEDQQPRIQERESPRLSDFSIPSRSKSIDSDKRSQIKSSFKFSSIHPKNKKIRSRPQPRRNPRNNSNLNNIKQNSGGINRASRENDIFSKEKFRKNKRETKRNKPIPFQKYY